MTGPPSQTDHQGAEDLHGETLSEDSSSWEPGASLCSFSKEEEEEDSPVGVTSDISQTKQHMTSDPLQSPKYRKYEWSLSERHDNASGSGFTGSGSLSGPVEVTSTDTPLERPGSPDPDEPGAGGGSLSVCGSALKPEEEEEAERGSGSESPSSESLDEPVRASLATGLQFLLKNAVEKHHPHLSQQPLNNSLAQHRLLDTQTIKHWCSGQKSPLTSVKPLGVPLSPLSTEGIAKDAAGLSRTSVIFTSGSSRQPESPEQAGPDPNPLSRSPQNDAPNPERFPMPGHVIHRANSQGPDNEHHGVSVTKEPATCAYSPSDADAERKDSFVSIPQSEESPFFFRAAYCLALRPSDRSRECVSVSGSSLPQIKREKCSSSSPSSSDEAGSVSAGDCESSPLKDKGREVSACVGWHVSDRLT